MTRADYLRHLITQKVLVLDGAMGTMIQKYPLSQEDYYYDTVKTAFGCNEILSLSRSDIIYEIHAGYLQAGADIIETNTFGANAFSLVEYTLQEYVYDLNVAAAEIAKMAVEEIEASTDRYAFVAGVVGPTGKSASFSPSVDDPTYRSEVFDDFYRIYREQIGALIDGGVDLLLIETVFDTLVAKAAVVAAVDLCTERSIDLPIMVSVTMSDGSHRTLSGQTLEAFVITMAAFPLFSLGINCSMGAKEMVPLIRTLSELSPFPVSAHPNAGFPDVNGIYTQSAQEFSSYLAPILQEGLIHIVGGCCGTSYDHIKELSHVRSLATVGRKKEKSSYLSLSALEGVTIPRNGSFTGIGERANVAGSRKFLQLMRERKFEQALAIVRSQIAEGAKIIDICMDDPLLDAKETMISFLRHIAADPQTAKVPIMIDSSDWMVITSALEEVQGRALVNSISLKEGEEVFLQRALWVKRMGGAFVVMLFDEQGQADTFERKCETAKRSYEILTQKAGCDPSSIVFDANILAIGTGIEAHDYYAKDFIRAISWIKQECPYAYTSGGVSNLSFSFRGNTPLREAIHAVFLDIASQAGLDMAIVNPSSKVDVNTLPPAVKEVITEALLLTTSVAGVAREALIELALHNTLESVKKARVSEKPAWRSLQVEERLSEAIVLGDDTYLSQDLEEASHYDAVSLIEGPLMRGMERVGTLFGKGAMYLPQVVRSARIMKKAVDILQPRLQEHAPSQQKKSIGTIVLATVKGDVHDIGKNIVSLVLQCNNFTVIDLGVMVPPQTIVDSARIHQADIIGLSGLISPSLHEMVEVCTLCRKNSLQIPVLIGGATTSKLHTALRIAPALPDLVVHTKDASECASVALTLASSQKDIFLQEQSKAYEILAREYDKKNTSKIPLIKAREKRWIKKNPSPKPSLYGNKVLSSISVTHLTPLINWHMFVSALNIQQKEIEAQRAIEEALALLQKQEVQEAFNSSIKAVFGLYPAQAQDEDVLIYAPDMVTPLTHIKFFRQQTDQHDRYYRSLADYIAQEGDTIGMFVATMGRGYQALVQTWNDSDRQYDALLLSLLSDRLAEALSEYVQNEVSLVWKDALIRPAIGYSSLPDHGQKEIVFHLLSATELTSVTLTENYAMDPVSSVAGFYFAGEGSSYFSIDEIGDDQRTLYAQWRGLSIKELDRILVI